MEVEDGECSGGSSCCSDEDEPNSAHLTVSAEKQDSGEANGVLLTALQQQLQKDLNRPRDSSPQQLSSDVTIVREEEEEEDKVPLHKLQELGYSEAVCGMLGNPYLRQLLLELDDSPAPQQALRRAMNIPVFVEFADECLRVCGLRDNEDS